MPPGFFFPDQRIQAWLPLTTVMTSSPRGVPMLHALVRLKANVGIERAQTEVDGMVRRLRASYPQSQVGLDLGVGLFSLEEILIGQYRSAFAWLMGGTGLLLLISCSNVTHLYLSRTIRRTPEIATRMALGARRTSIFRLLMVESILLSIAGSVVGSLAAVWGVRILRGLALTDIPRFSEAMVDHRALLFALGVSVLTGLAAGLLPALGASRLPSAALKTPIPVDAHGGRLHARDIIVVSEIALAFVLVAGAALLISSFVRLATILFT
jgi:hypothetical protein